MTCLADTHTHTTQTHTCDHIVINKTKFIHILIHIQVILHDLDFNPMIDRQVPSLSIIHTHTPDYSQQSRTPPFLHAYTFSPSLSLACARTRSFSFSLSPSYTLCLALSRSRSRSFSLTPTNTHAHTHPPTHSYPLTHARALSLSLSLSLSLPLTLTRLHARVLSLTHTLSPVSLFSLSPSPICSHRFLLRSLAHATLQHTAYEQVMSCMNVPMIGVRSVSTHHIVNQLQNTATHCNPEYPTVLHRHTLQRTATHCNTLQHTATHMIHMVQAGHWCHCIGKTCTITQNIALHPPATCCRTLQHMFIHCAGRGLVPSHWSDTL